MIISEILNEKYSVQKRLVKKCKSIHEFFDKSYESAELMAKKYGIKLKYEKLPNKSTLHTAGA